MNMITGSLVAIVTPMQDDGSLDFPRLRSLIDWHIAEGTDGIVVVGTTGESPTVNVDEHCELIRATVQHVAGRVPVIAGTGANSTAEAVELARFASQAGATAHLSVVPYYNRPTQEGLYRHFRTIAEAVAVRRQVEDLFERRQQPVDVVLLDQLGDRGDERVRLLGRRRDLDVARGVAGVPAG